MAKRLIFLIIILAVCVVLGGASTIQDYIYMDLEYNGQWSCKCEKNVFLQNDKQLLELYCICLKKEKT